MSEDKDRKLATNRLLDILRSQRVGETVEEEEPVQEKEATEGETEPEDETLEDQLAVEEETPVEQVTPLQEEATSIGPGDEPTSDDDKKGGEGDSDVAVETTPVDEEITPQDLLKTLDKIKSGVSTQEEKKESQKTQVEIPKEQPSPVIKPNVVETTSTQVEAQKSTLPGSSNLLDQIQKPEKKPEPKKEKEVLPKEFDSSLLSTISIQKQKPVFQDYLRSLFHLFNESRRRVTINSSEKSIKLLQIKSGFKKTEIEKVKEYTLPYKTEENEIEDNTELLKYIINNELNVKDIKYAYGTYYSSHIETKTHVLQAPSLSKKELSDLIEWNAKKNIPFSPDQAIIDYEVSKETLNGGGKHNIVIGISEENSVEEVVGYFKESKLKPRLISTLPVLMWKLFVRNYPERKRGSYILVHLGESKTTVILVKNQQLLFTREILFGSEDFYKAAMQKVVTEDQTFKIDYPLARELLAYYGIPEDTQGVTSKSHISLYKLSIFLRPAIERLTSELNRSMKYFTKQMPDLEWNEVLFDGVCATFPNLVTSLGENLNVKVGLLNPMRKGLYHFKDNHVLQNSQMPLYTVNFALASEEAEKINILPKNLKTNYRYLFLYKVAAVLVALLIPIYVVTTYLSGLEIDSLREQIKTRGSQWDKLSVQAQEYIGLMTDIDILSGYQSFLENDRIHSNNQIKILKLLSNIVPKDIKLTKVNFKKVAIEAGKDESGKSSEYFLPALEVSGFVQADASVSDIHLTNFIMTLEQSNLFSSIHLQLDETSKSTAGKLFFSVNMEY